MKKDEWTNQAPLTLRQKLAVMFIVIAVQILSPYEFDHQFKEQWADIKEKLWRE